jgi:transcriptional regulator with XRE-family HTH domain
MLAGLTQADLPRAAGCHPRSVRYWENKGSNPPTNVASTLDSIEQALNRHGRNSVFDTDTRSPML